VVLGGAALVLAGGVTAAVVVAGGSDATPQATPTAAVTGGSDDSAVVDVVPSPTDVAGARQPDGTVVFTWQTPDAVDGDRWVVRRDDPGADAAPRLVDAPTFTVADVPVGQETCIEVAVRRPNGRTSAAPVSACAG
jgi:hypothetical protein